MTWEQYAGISKPTFGICTRGCT
ncbi:hypothetical protein STIAU_2564, partial [Stigmatella aurantiaca DW4/3-1]